MVFVSDQFEVEMMDQYSGSYTDGIFTPGSIFDGTRKVYMSNANPDATSSLKQGFRLNSLTQLVPLFGRGLKLGSMDLVVSASSQTITSSFTCSLPQENIPSPSKNSLVKLFSVGEQFADTVLPSPVDIYDININEQTGQSYFIDGIYKYINPWGFYVGTTGLAPLFSVTNVSGPIPRTGKHFNLFVGTNNAYVIAGPAIVSDTIWSKSYPFEYRYSQLPKYIKPGFNRTVQVAYSMSIATFVNGAGLFLTGGIHQDPGLLDNPYLAKEYTLTHIFQTAGVETPYGDVSETHPGSNRNRYITLEKVATVVTKSLFKPTGSWSHPDLSFIYKGFYGTYKNHGSSTYQTSLYGNGVDNNTMVPPLTAVAYASMSHDGFGRFNPAGRLTNYEGWPSNPSCDGLAIRGTITQFGVRAAMFAVEDSNSFYLRLNGWKYGIYSGDPTNSFCYWRRSRYGQFRDRLEQRPFTKFYDTKSGVGLTAPVRITFLSGTNAYVTASNQALNTLDSGIYDFEGKSGRPFDDRDGID